VRGRSDHGLAPERSDRGVEQRRQGASEAGTRPQQGGVAATGPGQGLGRGRLRGPPRLGERRDPDSGAQHAASLPEAGGVGRGGELSLQRGVG
jgi:hypothetical protein